MYCFMCGFIDHPLCYFYDLPRQLKHRAKTNKNLSDSLPAKSKDLEHFDDGFLAMHGGVAFFCILFVSRVLETKMTQKIS